MSIWKSSAFNAGANVIEQDDVQVGEVEFRESR